MTRIRMVRTMAEYIERERTVELKPCPFCGERLILLERYKEYRHPNNECILAFIDSEYGEVFFNEKDTLAIEAWNRRADN